MMEPGWNDNCFINRYNKQRPPGVQEGVVC
nr:MAG TPA: hypothetical protein [Caudoviricetes sp.]